MLLDVSSAKERWQAETCDQSKKAKSVSKDRTLQHGRHSHAERPERCLLHYPHCSGGQRIPPIPMEGQNIPVQLPAIRAAIGSVGLYQDYKTSSGLSFTQTIFSWRPSLY